jgi:ABC-type thiamin/hydroxymethylpyrimidine transport system permease subunit
MGLMKPALLLQRNIAKRTSVDIALMALFATLGIATKSVVQPIVAILTGPLYIPTGAVAGGVYMMWPVMAYGLIRKPGTATIISLTQAFFSLLIPIGNFGLFTFIIYLAPGLAIDGFFLLSKHKACCAGCCIGAAAIANALGTISYCTLLLALPEVPLVFFALLAAVSGCVGGFIANVMLFRTRKIVFQK